MRPRSSGLGARLSSRLQWAWAGFAERVSRLRWKSVARGAAWAGAGVGGAALLCIVAFFLALLIYTPDLPFDSDLYALNRPHAFTFRDAEGTTLGRSGAVIGDRLALKEMPPYLPAAFLAMEDRRFYDHGGIDYRGMLRALIVDIRAGHVVQGGSTITQQLAKTVFLSPKRTISRKLEEMAAARELESRLTKDQILELYLNRIYLGSGAYGVDGAARTYFGKSARDVTLAEAAMLASLTRAPSMFSPRRDLPKAQARAALVLTAMVETGAIGAAQADEARAHPATVIDRTAGVASNYFFDAAADETERLIGHVSGDFTVVTTMDRRMQDAANASVARVLDGAGRRVHASQAALVAMSTDGAVRAMVGGRDYADSTFNRATQAHRQPGSAFKPFVYLAAFESGLDPNTVRTDEPIDLDGYAPGNYRGTYGGAMTLHHALVHSVNTIAVQLCQEVNPSNVIAVARRLGIQSPLQPYASLALGTSEVVPLELTAAYAAFPTGGLRVQPYMVVEVRDSRGNVIYRRRPPARERVADQEKALWMNAVLYDAVQSGTGTAARVPGHEVAGKTGTTSDFKDAWFVGYSADMVTGVWVGNDDSAPMRHVTGGKLPAQIWSGFMRAALAGHRPLQLARSEPAPQVDLFAGMFGNVETGVTYVTGGGDGGMTVDPASEDTSDWRYDGDEEDTVVASGHVSSPDARYDAPAEVEVDRREASAPVATDAVREDAPAVATEPPPIARETRNLEDERRAMLANAPHAGPPMNEPPRPRRYLPPPNAAIPPPDLPPPDEIDGGDDREDD